MDVSLPRRRAFALLVATIAFAWSYWPTLLKTANAWFTEPDYSHGLFVVPFAACLCWLRRESLPRLTGPNWQGLWLIAASVAMRWASTRLYVDALDAWSMIVWLGGVALTLGGWRFFRWIAPVLAFLCFMVPLPYSVERLFSLPLQTVATQLSAVLLQLLGQPALTEGHAIILGEHRLEVVRACAGLRLFMGVVAMAFAFVLATGGGWRRAAVLLGAVVPVALFVNALRITTVGMFFQWDWSLAAKRFSHDFAGWVMILQTAILFFLLLRFFDWLMIEVEEVDLRDAAAGRTVVGAAGQG
ncbi:MAG: exosortase/archaeosortase family protein [Planctomycetales bacterium]